MIWGGRRKNRKWIHFFCGNAFWELFFPGEGLLRFIFSWGRPFEIYFFLEKGLRNFFFLDFLRALPQIINGWVKGPLLAEFETWLVNTTWSLNNCNQPAFSQWFISIIYESNGKPTSNLHTSTPSYSNKRLGLHITCLVAAQLRWLRCTELMMNLVCSKNSNWYISAGLSFCVLCSPIDFHWLPAPHRD